MANATPSESPAENLIQTLRQKGIRDERVLQAIAKVRRDRFFLPERRSEAWLDQAVAIDCGQTISQPFMVAVMTSDLELTGTERVLEIGTGSGYQTAILSRLTRAIWTIERHKPLSLRARSVLDGLGLSNIHFRVGDGTLGWPEAAPFDRILITAAAPDLPQTLFDQLAEGGILLAPIGSETSQRIQVIRKINGQPVARAGVECRFVPMIGEEGWDGQERA